MTVTKLVVCLALVIAITACGDDDDMAGVTNRPPVLQDQADVTMALGDTLRLTASAHDPEGHEFTYSVAVIATLAEIQSGYFASQAIDPVTGDFWFFPSDRDIPSRSFEFRAEDEVGSTAATQFTVYVQR